MHSVAAVQTRQQEGKGEMGAGEEYGGPNPAACPQEPQPVISQHITHDDNKAVWGREGRRQGEGRRKGGRNKRSGERERGFKTLNSSPASCAIYIDYYPATPTNFWMVLSYQAEMLKPSPHELF